MANQAQELPQRLQCPICKESMVKGEVAVTDSGSASLIIGASWDDLVFERKGAQRTLIGSKDRRTAYYCTACETSVVTSEESGFERSKEIGRGLARWLSRGGKNSGPEAD